MRAPPVGHSALRAGAVALALWLRPAGVQAQQPQPTSAGTRIADVARATWRGPGGRAEEAFSDSLVFYVARVAGVDVEPPRAAAVSPGDTVVLAHEVANVGNAADSLDLTASVDAGWPVALYLDADADGHLGPGDRPVAGPVPVAPRAFVALLVRVQVPRDVAVDRAARLTVAASSRFDPSVSDAVVDRLAPDSTAPALTLVSAADRARAAPGDHVAWTLRWSVRHPSAPGRLVVTDTLSQGLRYRPGSLRLDGKPLTDAEDGDAGSASAAAGAVRLVIDPARAGSGTLTLQTTVEPGTPAGRVLETRASARWSDGAGVASRQARATVEVAVAPLELRNLALTDHPVPAGEPLPFRLAVGNPSELTARELLLVDTVPAELEILSVDPQGEVDGAVVRWRRETLAPGDSFEVRVVTRSRPGLRGDRVVRNRADLFGDGIRLSAASDSVRLLGLTDSARLTVRVTAGSLTARLGERIPIVVTLSNEGSGVLHELGARASLPSRTRLVEGSVRLPADTAGALASVRTETDTLDVRLAGTLLPGESRSFRYELRVTGVPQAALVTRVRAEAHWGGEGEGVRVTSARGEVRQEVVRNRALETRTTLGRVWLDLNANGIQDADEPGAQGVDVWTEDGHVSSTDGTGRFSFPELRPGRHAYRLDPRTLPQAYALADGRRAVQVAVTTGWTSPMVSFALVPRADSGGSAPAAEEIERALEPFGGPAVELRLPPGSTPVAGPARRGTAIAPDPAPPADPVRVPPLRSAGARADDGKGSITAGTGIVFLAPADGAVLSSDRLYVGVRGEALRPVALFDGDSLLARGTLRPDGVHDFVGVGLTRGPHTLRVRTVNSWGKERWDSLRVHVGGPPARIVAEKARASLPADGRSTTRLAFQLLDRWGVPTTNAPLVTVEGKGIEVVGSDADASSVGQQLRASPTGRVEVEVRSGRVVGPASVRVRVADQADETRLLLLPRCAPSCSPGWARSRWAPATAPSAP